MSNLQTGRIPRSGIERELLRGKGQFWTPDWVADFMISYVLQDKPTCLLDPALGEGAFFRAAKRNAQEAGFQLELFGRDIDASVIEKANASCLDENDMKNVEIRDFILDPPVRKFPAIVANPPYIRHHRLSSVEKEQLREFARSSTGRHIDGRAGLHVYFLIRSLLTLAANGRLAFIVSADICEGVFAKTLWEWICSRYRLDAVVTFSSDAAPFPDVDTNALVFMIKNAEPYDEFSWIKCTDRNSQCIVDAISDKPRPSETSSEVQVYNRSLAEALVTGLSRQPQEGGKVRFTLGHFASVMRGIATGDNEFFFMTGERARELRIPDSFFVNAIGRTRDVVSDSIAEEDLHRLEADGRPTKLLSINWIPYPQLPTPIQKYIEEGEKRLLPYKSLIMTRNPWYKMETRKVPPILFAYLGRRSARFIRNHALVVPLTCLLCVYPKNTDNDFVERIWRVLSDPRTIANLRKVGKSYGGGAIKVEPRALERLPLPEELVIAEGLDKYRESEQLFLF